MHGKGLTVNSNRWRLSFAFGVLILGLSLGPVPEAQAAFTFNPCHSKCRNNFFSCLTACQFFMPGPQQTACNDSCYAERDICEEFCV
jgi:hypothetical protein